MTMSESGSVFGVSAENQTTNTNPSPARAVSMNNVVSSEASVPMFCASLETTPPTVAQDTAAVERNGTAKAVLGPLGGGSLPPGGTGPLETILGAREVPLTAHHWAAYDPAPTEPLPGSEAPTGRDPDESWLPEPQAGSLGFSVERLAHHMTFPGPWRQTGNEAAYAELQRLRTKLHRAADEVAYLRYTRHHATEHLLGDLRASERRAESLLGGLRASQARNEALVGAVAAARAPLLPWWAYYAALVAMALTEIAMIVATDSLWPVLPTVVAYACGVAAVVSGRVKR